MSNQTSTALAWWRRLDRWLDGHVWLLILLVVVIALRIPSLTEPYWYGDEGIYLTIGQNLRMGAVLYRDVFDHKTPIIYYLAALAGNQFNFRILFLFTQLWVLIGVYALCRKWQWWATMVTTGALVALTSLPWFEGLIPNGELFVYPWVVAALVIAAWKAPKASSVWLFMAGVCMGMAILTKVPAVFDAIAIGGAWLALRGQEWRWRWSDWLGLIKTMVIFLLGVGTPILLSFVWLWWQGALNEYIQYGWAYNFLYVQEWQVVGLSPVAAWILKTPVKLSIVSAILVGLFFNKWWPWQKGWIVAWCWLALVAVTLSNRPYPHYWLQLALPLSLAVGQWLHEIMINKTRQYRVIHTGALTLTILAIGIVSWWLQLGLYPVVGYYQRFGQWATGQTSWPEYAAQFDWLVKDNDRVAMWVLSNPENTLFIWGSDSVLYAQTNAKLLTPFTAAFHVDELKAREPVLQTLQAAPPSFVVVIKGAPIFPELEKWLWMEYLPSNHLDTMTVWRRIKS